MKTKEEIQKRIKWIEEENKKYGPNPNFIVNDEIRGKVEALKWVLEDSQ